MLDHTFVYDGEGFRGATGTLFSPVTQDEIDERNDLETVIESYGYLWNEAVADGTTTESQEDYIQGLIDSSDGYFFGHDDSGIHKIPRSFKEKFFPDAETFECVGGGRCISHGMEFEIILRPDLLKEALKFEEKPKAKISLVGGE